jgi:hypothetical protein
LQQQPWGPQQRALEVQREQQMQQLRIQIDTAKQREQQELQQTAGPAAAEHAAAELQRIQAGNAAFHALVHQPPADSQAAAIGIAVANAVSTQIQGGNCHTAQIGPHDVSKWNQQCGYAAAQPPAQGTETPKRPEPDAEEISTSSPDRAGGVSLDDRFTAWESGPGKKFSRIDDAMEHEAPSIVQGS